MGVKENCGETLVLFDSVYMFDNIYTYIFDITRAHISMETGQEKEDGDKESTVTKAEIPKEVVINFPPKVVIIVPYRDREQQRLFFIRHMTYILEDEPTGKYRFYFAEQCFGGSFNRGAVKNAGFLAVKRRWPSDFQDMTIVFNDIDVLPYTKNFLCYETTPGVVKHFYGFKHVLGGLVSFRGKDFERTNGFPHFYAYGYEDSVIQKRALDASLAIDRGQFFDAMTDKSTNIMALNDGVFRTGNFHEYSRFLSGELLHEGLSSVKKFDFSFDEDNQIIKIETFDFGRKEDAAKNLDVDLRVSQDIYNIKNRLSHLAPKKKRPMLFRPSPQPVNFSACCWGRAPTLEKLG
jgi:hypothetical protein